jgi:Fe-S-cluster containining protein
MPRTKKPRRQDLKPGEVLCTYCTAKCCRYFALNIDTPKKWDDYDMIRWYLAHDHTAIFVEDGDWYLLIQTKCNYLMDDNRCAIYDDRMEICRKYTTVNCEYDDDATYEKYFDAPEQIWEYAEAVLPRRRGRSRRPKELPDRLPILTAAEADRAATSKAG